MRVFAAWVCVAAVCSAACSNTDAPGDASTDTGADTTKPADATIDTAIDPVAACKSEAMRVAGLCSSSPQRKCFFEKYADLCLLERNTVITQALKCFNVPECHTFADPGSMTIDACIRMVSTNAMGMFSTEAKTAYCNKCGTSAACMGTTPFAIPWEHLSDSRNSQTAMCADNAADCAGADACLQIEFPDLFACFGASDGGSDAAMDSAADAAMDSD